jgi:hypothetical protein
MEKRICDLMELARTMFIHAMHRWPRAISIHLWPYALCHANHVLNNTPAIACTDGRTAQQLFGGTDVNVNSKHWIPFGCPSYILDNALQGQCKLNRWAQRA